MTPFKAHLVTSAVVFGSAAAVVGAIALMVYNIFLFAVLFCSGFTFFALGALYLSTYRSFRARSSEPTPVPRKRPF